MAAVPLRAAGPCRPAETRPRASPRRHAPSPRPAGETAPPPRPRPSPRLFAAPPGGVAGKCWVRRCGACGCGVRKYVSAGREGREAARCGAAGACRGCITRGEGGGCRYGGTVVPRWGLQGCEKAAGKRGCRIYGCRDTGLQRGRDANGVCSVQGCGDAGVRDAEFRSRRDVGIQGVGCRAVVCSVQRAKCRVLGARLQNERCVLQDSVCRALSAESRARSAAPGSCSAEGSKASRMAAAELPLSVPPCCALLLPSGTHKCPSAGRCSAPPAQRLGGIKDSGEAALRRWGRALARKGRISLSPRGVQAFVPGAGVVRMGWCQCREQKEWGGIGAWNRNRFVFPQRLACVPG